MKLDLHTHHNRCGHATGEIEDYILSAISKNLDIIGISDHSPYFHHKEDHPYPQIAMANSAFPKYIHEISRMKTKYKDKIEILAGLEYDYISRYKNFYTKIFSKYPLDYIIGSVHLSNGKDIFDESRWYNLTLKEKIEEKEIYYKLIKEAVNSGTFDILGHLDAMKGNYPKFSRIPTSILDDTLKTIANSKLVLEINTSGKTKKCGGWYPSNEILERYCFYGGEVTFGSDAHSIDRVCDEYYHVINSVKEIGFKKLISFKERRKKTILL